MSNNNNNNNGWSGSSSSGGGGNGNGDAVCSQCQQQCDPGLSAKGGFQTFNNNNNNNSTRSAYSVPPIQVTAKVLFGSVSAISALNAERKKKA